MGGRLDRLASLQTRHAAKILLAALLVSVGAMYFVRDLGLDSRFIALLPEDRPSVRDLESVRDRVRGLSTLTIAIQSPSKNVDGMQKFAADLVERLESYPPERIGVIDWNVRTYSDFVRSHRHQYAPLDLLERLRDSLEFRLDEERLKKNPFYVSLLEDDEIERVEDVLDELEAKGEDAEKGSERFPGGYYQHRDKDLIAIFSRSDLAGDTGGTDGLIKTIQKEVAELDPSKYANDLTVSFSGDVMIAREETAAIARELVVATSITVATVMLLIVIFFGRLRAIPLLAAGLLPAVLASFAIAEITVDALNTSTAFLGSIIIGNGANPNIIWLSRYFEERRKGQEVRDSIAATHRGAWLATLVASGAAALAYGSLLVTDFRGFRDFGIIGGAGMTLCWVSAMLVLPAAVALYERFRPLPAKKSSARRPGFADVFATIAERTPRGVFLASFLVTVAAIGFVYTAAVNDPVEYNFRNLRSERDPSESEARMLNSRVNKIIDSSQQGRGIAVLVPTKADLKRVQDQLDTQSDEIHGGYQSLLDLLPSEAEDKIEVLEEIRELCLELRPYADDETQTKIDDNIPPEQIARLSIDDLPEQVALRFTEKDGTRGRIMVVKEAEAASIWDGRYLVRWAGALRDLKLEDGSRPPLAGRATVFADVIAAVYDDMPKAISAALLATLLLVFFSFRHRRDSGLSILALLLGIVWMAGTMAALGMKLNFLNFVAFPITFGNGVDYSINVMRRYRLERDAGSQNPISDAVRLSGGAVVLCSLTTIVGYTSLYVSANRAMNSFGLAMAISEVTCLLAAVLTMPAIMRWLDARA